MNTPSTESQPLRERLLPQTSIRFLMLLIAGCGLVMYTFRAAIIGGQFWAKVLSLLIAMAIASLIASAVLFALANLFSTRLWRPSATGGPRRVRPGHVGSSHVGASATTPGDSIPPRDAAASPPSAAGEP